MDIHLWYDVKLDEMSLPESFFLKLGQLGVIYLCFWITEWVKSAVNPVSPKFSGPIQAAESCDITSTGDFFQLLKSLLQLLPVSKFQIDQSFESP